MRRGEAFTVSCKLGPSRRQGRHPARLKEDGTNVFERFRDVHPAYVDPAHNPLQNWQTFGYTLLWEVFDDPMGIVGGMWNQYVNKLPRYFNHDIFIMLDPQIDTRIREFECRNASPGAAGLSHRAAPRAGAAGQRIQPGALGSLNPARRFA